MQAAGAPANGFCQAQADPPWIVGRLSHDVEPAAAVCHGSLGETKTIVKSKWKRLEAWLQGNKPVLLADLNPPASAAEIRALEQRLGMKLTADFVEFLKVHNGQKGEAEWLFSGAEFLSTQRILSEWKVWKELLEHGDFDGARPTPDTGIKPVWWSAAWVPFTYDGFGNHLCLDLDPTSTGRRGQIISVWHDDAARKKVAGSFKEWFSEFVGKTV